MALSPEEITDILRNYFDDFEHARYIGMRYVPILGRKGESSYAWDNSAPYEPLTVVYDSTTGASYTSRQFVPIGVELSDSDYWAKTFDFNAQVANAEAMAQRAAQDAAAAAADAAAAATDAADADADATSALNAVNALQPLVTNAQNDATQALANAAANLASINGMMKVNFVKYSNGANAAVAEYNEIGLSDDKLATNFASYTVDENTFPSSVTVKDADGIYIQPGINIIFFNSTLNANANFRNVARNIYWLMKTSGDGGATWTALQRRCMQSLSVESNAGTVYIPLQFENIAVVQTGTPLQLALFHHIPGVDGAQNKPSLRYSELDIVNLDY